MAGLRWSYPLDGYDHGAKINDFVYSKLRASGHKYRNGLRVLIIIIINFLFLSGNPPFGFPCLVARFYFVEIYSIKIYSVAGLAMYNCEKQKFIPYCFWMYTYTMDDFVCSQMYSHVSEKWTYIKMLSNERGPSNTISLHILWCFCFTIKLLTYADCAIGIPLLTGSAGCRVSRCSATDLKLLYLICWPRFTA